MMKGHINGKSIKSRTMSQLITWRTSTLSYPAYNRAQCSPSTCAHCQFPRPPAPPPLRSCRRAEWPKRWLACPGSPRATVLRRQNPTGENASSPRLRASSKRCRRSEPRPGMVVSTQEFCYVHFHPPSKG